MKFEPIQTKKLYQLVIQQIKQMVYQGKLKKGDRLPSEREWATMLGVSRTAIREASSALEILGIIENVHGEGKFISDQAPDKKVIQPMSLAFMLEDNSEQDLMQVRAMLEMECAGLAACQCHEQQVSVLKQYITDFEMFFEDQTRCIEVDRMFHRMIAEASGNKLLNYIYAAISEVLDMHIADMRLKLVKKQQNIPILNMQHRRIVDAICNGDEEQARLFMKQHMKFVWDEAIASDVVTTIGGRGYVDTNG